MAVINNGQPVGLGPVSAELGNLETDKRYFFRAHAENIGGANWSPAYKFFTASDSRLTKHTLDGLVFWLDATDVDGDGQPDSIPPDQPLDYWIDKSNSGKDANQSVSGFRPTYAVSAFGDRPGIRFASGQSMLIGTIRADADGVHAFVVAKGSGVGIGATDGSDGWTVEVKQGSSLSSYKNEYTNIDRVAIGNDPATGYGQFLGDIAEVLIFDRYLSETEAQMVEGYLAHKWEVTEDLIGNSYTVKENLQLYFNFEETEGSDVGDSSPNRKTGTLNNAELKVSGKFGSGLQFPDADSYIDLALSLIHI